MKLKKKKKGLSETLITKVFETLVSLATTKLFELIVYVLKMFLSI